MDEHASGWTLLAGVMHRMDPDRDGYARCGRLVGIHATVHRWRNPGFDACAACVAEASSRPAAEADRTSESERLAQAARASRSVRTRQAAGTRATQSPLRPVAAASGAADTRALPARTVGTWKVPAGWCRLERQRVLHQPHPEQPDRVMCGRFLAANVPVYRHRPVRWPDCERCRSVRAAALAEQRAVERAAAAERRAVERAAAEAAAEERLRAAVERSAAAWPLRTPRQRGVPDPEAVNCWRSVGWVVLPDGDGSRAHRPHP